MKNQKQLLEELDQFLTSLSAPLSAQSLLDGWSPETQQSFLKLVRQLRATLGADLVLPRVSLARGLDFAGVTGGELAGEAAELSNDLDDYGRAQKAAMP